MRRLTAAFLVALMLVPALAPAAMAQNRSSLGAHCLRKPTQPVMECHHGMAMAVPGAADISIQAADPCCQDHSCCRGIASRQWAQASPRPVLHTLFIPEGVLALPDVQTGAGNLADSASARAPPRA